MKAYVHALDFPGNSHCDLWISFIGHFKRLSPAGGGSHTSVDLLMTVSLVLVVYPVLG